MPPAGGIETSKRHHHHDDGAADENESGPEHAKHIDAETRHPGDDKHVDHTAGADLKSSNVYDYRWTVPADHATGLFWYHPHPHGITEQQVLSGMSGLMIIEDFIGRRYPELQDLPRRALILKDFAPPGADDDPKTKTINGVLGGVTAAPGSFEIWEIGNLGADAYFDLALDGHTFWLLEQDGNALPRPVGDRSCVPAAGFAGTGCHRCRSSGAIRTAHPGGRHRHGRVIPIRRWSLRRSTSPAHKWEAASTFPRALSQPAADMQPDAGRAARIAALPVTRARTITYTESDDGKTFFINGRVFDMNRIDVDVKLGDVEEWTIVNDTDERHTFHIHQLAFLVQSVGGDPLEMTGMRDNVDVPFRDPKTRAPGVVKVKVPFTNPLIVGKFPFHCHILEHEDGGMMANVRVRAR